MREPGNRALCLFVFGTLLAGSATPMARWLAAYICTAKRASVPGRLFAVPSPDGWFPLLLPGRAGDRTWGQACDVLLPAGGLARLDRYEGREYRRGAGRALIRATGRRRTVQVYRWRVRLPRGARPIASGDFLRWIAATGERAYRTDHLRRRPCRADRSFSHRSLRTA